MPTLTKISCDTGDDDNLYRFNIQTVNSFDNSGSDDNLTSDSDSDEDYTSREDTDINYDNPYTW